jgi:hypothetical protein
MVPFEAQEHRPPDGGLKAFDSIRIEAVDPTLVKRTKQGEPSKKSRRVVHHFDTGALQLSIQERSLLHLPGRQSVEIREDVRGSIGGASSIE